MWRHGVYISGCNLEIFFVFWFHKNSQNYLLLLFSKLFSSTSFIDFSSSNILNVKNIDWRSRELTNNQKKNANYNSYVLKVNIKSLTDFQKRGYWTKYLSRRKNLNSFFCFTLNTTPKLKLLNVLCTQENIAFVIDSTYLHSSVVLITKLIQQRSDCK